MTNSTPPEPFAVSAAYHVSKGKGIQQNFGYLLAFAIGAAIGGMGTAIHFLSDAKSNSVTVTGYPTAPTSVVATMPDRTAVQKASVQSRKTTVDEDDDEREKIRNIENRLGASGSPAELGGAFFLGDDVDYIIDPSNPVPVSEARKIMAGTIKGLPGITVGNGQKQILVVFDPLCPKCHNFFKMIRDNKEINSQIKAKFVPANFFAGNESSRVASLYMLTKIKEGKPELAYQYFSDLVDKIEPKVVPIAGIDDDVIKNYNTATMAVLQANTKIPFVIFKSGESDEFELFSGEPEKEELLAAGNFDFGVK